MRHHAKSNRTYNRAKNPKVLRKLDILARFSKKYLKLVNLDYTTDEMYGILKNQGYSERDTARIIFSWRDAFLRTYEHEAKSIGISITLGKNSTPQFNFTDNLKTYSSR